MTDLEVSSEESFVPHADIDACIAFVDYIAARGADDMVKPIREDHPDLVSADGSLDVMQRDATNFEQPKVIGNRFLIKEDAAVGHTGSWFKGLLKSEYKTSFKDKVALQELVSKGSGELGFISGADATNFEEPKFIGDHFLIKEDAGVGHTGLWFKDATNFEEPKFIGDHFLIKEDAAVGHTGLWFKGLLKSKHKTSFKDKLLLAVKLVVVLIPSMIVQPPLAKPRTYMLWEPIKVANDAILKNMQTNMTSLKNLNLELKNMYGQFRKMNTVSSSSLGLETLPGNTITNPKEDLKGITTRSGTAYQGPTIPTTSSSLPKVVERETEVTKDTVPPTNNGSTKDVQPLVVQVENPKPNSEPVAKPVAAPVSAPKPNPKPLIPYPSRLHDQKLCDKANDQKEKFFQIFKDLDFNISFCSLEEGRYTNSSKELVMVQPTSSLSSTDLSSLGLPSSGSSTLDSSTFMKMNTALSSGSRTLPSNPITNPKEDLNVECETEVTKNTMPPTNNESTKDVQPPVVEVESPILNSEPVVPLVIEPVVAPVSAPKPKQKPLIPYPSIFHDQKLHDKAND
uniref:Reverse transcriptase domain-containing protein n=1 Tax=Tanacetum cinerariifolium TaxID=118510 RepID=A0A6L2NDN6_TANCI|nr:reverse transcriptase domain-containing protein [Tanacetum cinerariifolium]